jgi:hypothetical protein
MSLPININDNDIDAQAVEIFSNDEMRCVATKKAAERIENLSEIERTVFVEELINEPMHRCSISGSCAEDLKVYDPLTGESVGLPRGVYYEYAMEIIEEIPGRNRHFLLKLLKFRILDDSSSSQTEDEFNDFSEFFD